MKTVSLVKKSRYTESGSAVALGCFDGMHKGHMHLLKRTAEIAAEGSLSPIVYSIDTLGEGTLRITSSDERKKLFARAGIETLCTERLDDIRFMLPEEFIDYLTAELHALYFICGFNFTFGRDRTGNADTLKRLCLSRSIGCEIIPRVYSRKYHCTVSSSEIRRAILSNDTEKAECLLGRKCRFEQYADKQMSVGEDDG